MMSMSTSACICPLCDAPAHAGGVDYEERAKVYCDNCGRYELTHLAFNELTVQRKAVLAKMAGAASAGKILVVQREASGGAHYEDERERRDHPAPPWVPRA